MTTFFVSRVDADSIAVRAQMLDERRGLQGDFCQIVRRGGRFGALRFADLARCARRSGILNYETALRARRREGGKSKAK